MGEVIAILVVVNISPLRVLIPEVGTFGLQKLFKMMRIKYERVAAIFAVASPLAEEAVDPYAITCRRREAGKKWRVESMSRGESWYESHPHQAGCVLGGGDGAEASFVTSNI